jgi:hypothetical protein
MLDPVDMNKLEPKVIEGDDLRGSDDFVEAEVIINGKKFVFHIEPPDENNPKKARGLIGVRHEDTAEQFAGPLDPTHVGPTWARVECDKCGRSGQYRVDRLIMRYGIDAKLFDWSEEITADCQRKQARNLNDQCSARCPDLSKVV